ncbi:signal peptide peptidase SppA [Lentibacillus amyloliquefaciens]|uniref:Signal peptide peptidase SppA n=1 Tax=Lentibacillus amyloliquefaciens TaxID=1472767 RepID=A0A0U4E698_9BACI|nr:signal peptide peptidase SppA [Lentibacillus amyloliquefaciens]ALX48812.1 signal peptide peptidase SppA [Lentibacillus amyloliquefaciens]
MNKKRWLALGIAVFLLVASLGFRFMSSVFSTDLESLFAMSDQQYQQEVIQEGTGNKIAVVELDGMIQDVSTSSLLNSGGYNHDRFLKKLEHVGEDRSVSGIILRVNTPGGGVVESDEIHDKIVEIQEEHNKPVYVSMGNTAASGGYYVAAPADKIVAHQATLTGSIGVIMQSYNVTELADQLGVDVNTIKSGEFKDIMSATREMTDEERDILQTMIDGMYDDFVQVIVEGRDMSESTVRELGDGRVYTGQQAADNGLVDGLGDLEDTAAMMQEDLDWSNARVVKYNNGYGWNTYINGKVQTMFQGEDAKLTAIQELIQQSDGPRAMYLYSK